MLSFDAPEYLLIAGGIGVTPIIGMARALQRRRAAFCFIYAGRSLAEMAYVDELEAEFGHTIHVHADDESGLPDLSGFFANLHQQAEVYVCGPIGLLDAGKRFWKLAKRDPVNFVFETFGASGHVPTEGFTVHIPRLGTNVEVPPDFSMLDALENAGVGVISDCRRGECGLCVLDILNVDGVVYHGDMFFSEDQHAQNRRICACVSRVRGAITVDRLINRTTLTAAEIGDQIVSILELRLAAMRAELQKLGVEYQGGSR